MWWSNAWHWLSAHVEDTLRTTVFAQMNSAFKNLSLMGTSYASYQTDGYLYSVYVIQSDSEPKTVETRFHSHTYGHSNRWSGTISRDMSFRPTWRVE